MAFFRFHDVGGVSVALLSLLSILSFPLAVDADCKYFHMTLVNSMTLREFAFYSFMDQCIHTKVYYSDREPQPEEVNIGELDPDKWKLMCDSIVMGSGSSVYTVLPAEDCVATPVEGGTTIWFYFGIEPATNCTGEATLTYELVNTGAVVYDFCPDNGTATLALDVQSQGEITSTNTPTDAPTDSPTTAPQKDTSAPVVNTLAPTSSPSQGEITSTNTPTDAPTDSPTDSPTAAPQKDTSAPVVNTLSPTSSPTITPPICVDLGGLTDYVMFIENGSSKANWQGATKGFAGDVAVDGVQAKESTSGTVPFAGTLVTNDADAGAFKNIVDDDTNAGQATLEGNAVAKIEGLTTDLTNAFAQIDGLEATPLSVGDVVAATPELITETSKLGTAGYVGIDSGDLQGLNVQDGVGNTYVFDITSGFDVKQWIYVTGDKDDVFVLRWDDDLGTSGYQGQVKASGGGAVVPQGELTAGNFINVAGDINASGGGGPPPPPFPQGVRLDNGTGDLINDGDDFGGSGFFVGYWLTTGDPGKDFQSSDLSNAIIVGGWYTSATSFSLTSGSSAVYVSPNYSCA